jgi:hypothetical protein
MFMAGHLRGRRFIHKNCLWGDPVALTLSALSLRIMVDRFLCSIQTPNAIQIIFASLQLKAADVSLVAQVCQRGLLATR